MCADRITERAPEVASANHGATTETPLHVDIFQRLSLDDPARKTVYDYYSDSSVPTTHDKQVDAMLSKFGIDDPTKFDDVVHKLYSRATVEHVPLNKDALEKFSQDNSLSSSERAAAQVIHDNYRDFVFAGGKPIGGSLVPSAYLSINQNDIADIDDKSKLLQTARQHPELHDPKVLAAEAKSLFDSTNPYQFLYSNELSEITDDKRYSYLQRVTAMALNGDNFDKIAAVNQDSSSINAKTLDHLTTVGQPKPADWVQNCIAAGSIDVAEKTIEGAAVGGAIAYAIKGKPMRSAAVAAGTVAIIASIHNANVESSCKKEYEATK